jgi:phenylpropionate dioxygenase-like ring-hydroxylating dioxygenase large terminal subunit
MRWETQVDIGREIVTRLADGSTPMADEVYWNEPAVYVDPERHAEELPIFFGHYPLAIAASCQIPNPGDVVTDDHTHVPIMIVRGADRKARAFANICRHRGSRIVLGQQVCGFRGFTCPYHAWAYGLEGDLRAIPGAGFSGLDRQALGLIELPSAERAGLIWVLPEPATATGSDRDRALDLGPTVEAHLGDGLLADLEAFGLADHHHYRTDRFTRRLNWKLTLDTFFESYHFRQLHRDSIAPIVRSDQAPVRHHGDHHLMVAVRHSAELLASTPESDWDIKAHTVLVYLLWPNTIFLFQKDHVELFRIFPGETVAHSAIEASIFVPEDPDSTADPARARRHWDANFELLLLTADDEDFTNGATIQRSFDSGVLPGVVYGRNEPLMHSWHESLKRVLGEHQT